MNRGILMAHGHGWSTVRAVAVALAVLTCSSAVGFLVQADSIALGPYEAHPTRILAKFKAGNDDAVSPASVRLLGSTVTRRYRLVPGLAVLDDVAQVGLAGLNATDDATKRQRLLARIQALKDSGLFEYVEPDYIVHPTLTPNDAAFVDGTLWGLQNLGQSGGAVGADIAAPTAWDLTTGSTNVVVAVIDTGVRYTHQELTNQMWINPLEIAGNRIDDDNNGFVDDVHGINAITGTGDPMDDQGHGTHVSGTIGASANDGYPHVGVAWNVRLMGCKFLGTGGGTTSDGITCIDYATAMGVKILNNSWGGYGFSQALFDSIRRARDQGVLFLAAAGNDAVDNDVLPHYPSSYQLDNVVSVAALDRFDNLADFSNYGATTVHLGAPGVEIYSCWNGFDADYSTIDGTSMATPHVAGVAALILGLHPGSDYVEMRDRLLSGVVPVTALAGVTTTGGRLNAYNSLTLTGSGLVQVSVDPPSGSTLLAGSTQPMFVTVRDRFGIRNATVIGNIVGGGTLTFANNGVPPDAVAQDPTYSANLRVPALVDSLTMTLTVSAPGKLTVTNLLTYTVVPFPTNDDFGSATKVPRQGSSYLANNKFATMQPGEPRHGGIATAAGSLWWSWTAENDTNILVDASGSGIGVVLAVYTGNAVGNLKAVASVANAPGTRGTNLVFAAKTPQVYSIAVSGRSTNQLGSIRLRVIPGGELQTQPPRVSILSPVSGLIVTTNTISVRGTAEDAGPQASGIAEVLVSVNGALASSAIGTTNWTRPVLLRVGANQIAARSVNLAGLISDDETITIYHRTLRPENDDFDSARVLTGTEGADSMPNSLATLQPNEPLHAGKPGGHSLWWKWTAPADGAFLLSSQGSSLDTTMGLYTGPRVNALRTIASNDDAFDGSQFSKLQEGVRANHTYYLAIDGFNGLTGTVQLAYSFAPGALYTMNLQATEGGTVAEHDLGLVDVPADSSQTLTAVPASGYDFAGWEGAVVTTANPVSLQVSSNLTVRATFRPTVYTDDFESGGLTKLGWVTGGAQPWAVTAEAVSGGTYAAGSGAIGNAQVSTLSLTERFLEGTVAFDLRVSSEANWDFAEFLIDGVLKQKWSGEVDWDRYSYPVTTGTHTLEWRYSKDNTTAVGLDAVFMDNFTALIVPPTDETTPATLTLERLPQGDYELRVVGQTNQVYLIQQAAALVPGGKTPWVPYSTNVAEYGEVRIILDQQALSAAETYFRAVAK